ncbi:MAG: RluA family pseudouridine synthase [Firmicutes bacterium]|nr:RluA family pseudouridine synthase [Bacillota bacterium]
MKVLIVDKNNAGQRLDKFILKYLNKAPKSFVYKMLRKKNIKLNGKKAEGNEMISANDEVTLFLADDTIDGFRGEISVKKQHTSPDIIYEDENIIAVNKPAGMPVQGGDKAAENLNDILLYYLKQKGELTDIFKPGVANRLDRNTGGIVVMGKNLAAAQALAEAFRENKADKRYIAAVCGKVEKSGEISGWHSKDGKNKVTVTKEKRKDSVPVKTLYKPLFTGEKYSILSVKLITGKSHQIRESLNITGHPIIGDPKYGDPKENEFFKKNFGFDHQLLYAVSLELNGQTGILEYLNNKKIECKPDKKAEKVLEYIRK